MSQAEATLVEVSPEMAGRYQLLGQIGAGSMGEVWRAEDPQIGRPVAVKLLNIPQGLAPEVTAEWEARFLREARAAGKLSHAGIVPVYDVGRTSHGRPFIVMELVQGRSLEAIMKEGPPPPAETALAWGAQVAEALFAAHQRGIVHRDIKPANILIDHELRARIADFGIARISESELTREGVFLGSPAYTAPEQLRGGAVDGRSDLFSLGSTLYALLTGVRPFRGQDLTGLAYAICHVEPEPPSSHRPGIPPACDVLIMKALAKDPDRRYATAIEMAEALGAAAQGRWPASTDAGRDGAAGASHGEKRPLAAIDSKAEILMNQAASSVEAGALAAARWATAASRAAAPVLKRLADASLEASERAWRLARRGWSRGWAMGPRVRAAMVGGLVVLLVALVAMTSWMVESRRDSPGRRMKKAFQSVFSELVGPGEGAVPREVERHG